MRVSHTLALVGTQLQISGVCLLFFSLCLPLLVPYPLSSPSLVLYPDNSSCFGLSAQTIQLRTSVGSLLGSPLLYKSLENSLLSLSFLMWEKSMYLEPVSRVVFEEWCIYTAEEYKCKFHFPYIVLYIIYTFLKINFEKWQLSSLTNPESTPGRLISPIHCSIAPGFYSIFSPAVLAPGWLALRFLHFCNTLVILRGYLLADFTKD